MGDRSQYFFVMLDSFIEEGAEPLEALELTVMAYAFVYHGGSPGKEVMRAAQVELERIAKERDRK